MHADPLRDIRLVALDAEIVNHSIEHPLLDSANATPAWLTAPDAAPPLVAVDLSSFVDAALEAEVWALDARLARAEAAA